MLIVLSTSFRNHNFQVLFLNFLNFVYHLLIRTLQILMFRYLFCISLLSTQSTSLGFIYIHNAFSIRHTYSLSNASTVLQVTTCYFLTASLLKLSPFTFSTINHSFVNLFISFSNSFTSGSCNSSLSAKAATKLLILP